MMFIVNQIVCPVFVGELRSRGHYNLNGSISGTCFSIGGGIFLSAGHVVRELEARSSETAVLIGVARDCTWSVVKVLELEVLDADIGVLRISKGDINIVEIPTMAWNIENLPVFADVRTAGYPYGIYMADDEPSIVARAFQGTVVCTLPNFKPIGFERPSFSVHELSFAAPRGLSGAPLFAGFDPPSVKGIVIGNSSSEMLAHSETEKERDGQSSYTIERVERLSLGIAVRAIHIASLNSTILESSIADHLRNEGLLT